jgi:hypothetical protein
MTRQHPYPLTEDTISDHIASQSKVLLARRLSQADQQPNTVDIISTYQPDTTTKTITNKNQTTTLTTNTLNSALGLDLTTQDTI